MTSLSGPALSARIAAAGERAGRAQELAGRGWAARRRLFAVLPALAGVVLQVGRVLRFWRHHARQRAAASPAGTASSSGLAARTCWRLVVPPGPVQNGNVIPQVDWVTPFEAAAAARSPEECHTDAEAAQVHHRGRLTTPVLASPSGRAADTAKAVAAQHRAHPGPIGDRRGPAPRAIWSSAARPTPVPSPGFLRHRDDLSRRSRRAGLEARVRPRPPRALRPGRSRSGFGGHDRGLPRCT